MKVILAIIVLSLASGFAHAQDKETAVRATIQAFYDNFNEGFTGSADYATEDWNHINPTGGRTQGRKAVLKRLRLVHQTFLKGAHETATSMEIRFATDEVAVGTVISSASPFVSPDGSKHEAQQGIRTFVLVKRGDRWLIMQDHSTTITSPPR